MNEVYREILEILKEHIVRYGNKELPRYVIVGDRQKALMEEAQNYPITLHFFFGKLKIVYVDEPDVVALGYAKM